MEYWSYACRGKGFISDESVSAPSMVPKCKDGSMGWELKTPCSFESNSQGAIENQGFVELGFPEMMSKSLPNGSIGDVLGSRICGGRMFSSVTDSRNAFSGEKESSSKLSSSIVESNCGDSALIDLKLGRFADQREARSFNSSKTTPKFSSAESSMPAKRARVGGLSSSTPLCQVHGCKKDLSSSKDYHKRHKVCDIHSKTAKVIVNGIEQRFCQQCSRFHLLSEFDDGKRSCRKRLAGHNERRRKPHVGIHYGRHGMLFQSYNGSRFQGNPVTTASFICQDTYPSSLLHPEKYETNEWCRHIKVEDGADYSSQSAIPIANEQLHHPKSPFPSYGFEKHCSPLHDNGISTRTGIKSNGNCNRYQHDMANSNFVPRSLFQNTSLGGESFTAFDSASTVQALSGVSDSGCALSLLSSQSQNSSSHSAGVPMSHPLILPANHAHCSVTQVSEKLVERSPQASMSGVSNKFNWSGINSLEVNHLDPILISDGCDAVNFGINGMLQGSAEDRLSCDGGPTIDLLQLSSQLQRVEHQRQSQQVKQDHNSFYGLRIT